MTRGPTPHALESHRSWASVPGSGTTAEAPRTTSSLGKPARPWDPRAKGGIQRRAPREVAIIGLGAWGLSVLERFVAVSRAQGPVAKTTIHVVEPGVPGAGIYDPGQPDYFIMNTVCGEMCLTPRPSESDCPYAISLYDWAVDRGYRWVGDACRRDPSGRPLTEHDFLPRRVMGEYLHWFYQQVVAARSPAMEVVHHRCSALDIVPQGSQRERVDLDDGTSVTVDHVIITSGHTDNATDLFEGRLYPAYPVEAYRRQIGSGRKVILAGMGLVAADVVAALTVGSGGYFTEVGTSLRYHASGREPAILAYSRGGVFHAAKAVAQRDATDEYQLRIWTDSTTADLRARRNAHGRLDARVDILPLIYAEMRLRYIAQALSQKLGVPAAHRASRRLVRAWREGAFAQIADSYSQVIGEFDPQSHVFPTEHLDFHDSDSYQSYVYDCLERDAQEALAIGGSSPVKAAYEVLRYLRDPMRQVIEFGALSAGSYRDFATNIRGRLTRLVAGPPVVRSRQALALMDAGVLRVPLGPDPHLSLTDPTSIELRSTRLVRPARESAEVVIRGHIDDPSVHRSASPLLSRLYGKGRITQMRLDGEELGSVDLTPDFHPISRNYEVQSRLWMFGVATEGARYFTYYVPSPRSRVRAFLDAQVCAQEICG